MKFKIGDIVNHKNKGFGKIIGVDPSYTFPYILLLDSGGVINTSEEYLSQFILPKQTIVIKYEDDTVTAYMGKHKAVAKCSPSDEFDLYKGAVSAITRLLVEGEING